MIMLKGSCIVLICSPSPPPFLVIIISSEWSLSVGPQDKEVGGKTEGVWEALVSR